MRTRILLLGLSIWGSCGYFLSPFHLQAIVWVYLLLLFAPLVIFPFIFVEQKTQKFQSVLFLLATASFTFSFLIEPSLLAGLLVLPYFLFIAHRFLNEADRFWRKPSWQITDFLTVVPLLNLLVGILWAFADRIQVSPFGFSPVIVLLTAAHLHYAGFILPFLCHQLVTFAPSKERTLIAWGILLGFPITAIGITASHFGLPLLIEQIGATFMAFSAMGLAISQLYLFRKYHFNFFSTALLLLFSLSLLSSMVFALLYAWRLQAYFPWITIPWMYAVHGSLNVFGMGLIGTLFWVKFKPIEGRMK